MMATVALTRALIKPFLAFLFRWAGISSLFYFLNRGRKRILTYHNVLPDSVHTGVVLEGMSHSESVFKEQVRYIRSKFACNTNLDDPSTFVITFDDGYANQFLIADPILTAAGLQAYFFVSTVMLETGTPLPIDSLQCWISYAPVGTYTLHIAGMQDPLVFSTRANKDRLAIWQAVDSMLATGVADESTLLAAFDRCVPLESVVRELDQVYRNLRLAPLTPNMLASLRDHGHLVGQHGYSHRMLSRLDDASLEAEVRLLNGPDRHEYNTRVFSYPFGGPREVTPRVIDLMRALGWERALSNVNEPLGGSHQYCDLFIPRMTLPNSANRNLLAFILSGAEYFLKYRQLLPRGPTR